MKGKSVKALRNFIVPFMFLVSNVDGQQDFTNDVEGYLEPYHSIEVSSVETGIVDSIEVREGETVKKGQVLVKLDRDVLTKSLEVAAQEAKSLGNLQAAKAELVLQKTRLEKVQRIFDSGHGRSSELERAKADLEVALGRVLRAEEEIVIKQKELAQIKAKLASRDVLAPIDGIVIEIHKNPGEAVSPNNPILVTVVNVNRLKCILNVPRLKAGRISEQQPVELLTDQKQSITGSVQWKSPIVDAESETVKIVIRIDNSAGRLTSGEHCILHSLGDLADSQDKHESHSVSLQD